MKTIITENVTYKTVMECNKIPTTGDYSLVIKGVHTLRDGSVEETIKSMVFMTHPELMQLKSFINTIDE